MRQLFTPGKYTTEDLKSVLKLPEKEALQKLIQFCRADPIFFIEHFVVVPDYPEKLLKLSDKQKYIVKSIVEDHYIIILGSRQTGKTTVTLATMLWMLILFPHYRAAIISRDGDHANDLIRDLMTMYEYLPDFLKIGVEKDVAHEKIFKNESWIKAYPIPNSNPEKVGRGIRAGFILIDEAAFIPHIERVYTALTPTTARIHPVYEQRGYPYGMTIISTPNKTYGRGRWFYLQWLKAQNGESIFKPITYHWSETGFYDEAWAQRERQKYSEEDWLQEFELQFLSGGSGFFNLEVSKKLTSTTFDPIESKEWLDGRYRFYLYEEPPEDALVLIGIDTASEDGLSDQAIVVTYLDKQGQLHVIGEGYGKVPFKDFGDIVLEIASRFKRVVKQKTQAFQTASTSLPPWLRTDSTQVTKWPWLFIERNYLGEALIGHLLDKEPKLYEYIYASTKVRNGKLVQIDGIQTTSKTRTLILDSVKKFVESNLPILDDVLKANKLRTQLAALERDSKGRVTAPPDIKDDLVFALGFITYSMEYDEDNFIKQVLSSQTVSQKEIDQYMQLLNQVRM